MVTRPSPFKLTNTHTLTHTSTGDGDEAIPSLDDKGDHQGPGTAGGEGDGDDDCPDISELESFKQCACIEERVCIKAHATVSVCLCVHTFAGRSTLSSSSSFRKVSSKPSARVHKHKNTCMHSNKCVCVCVCVCLRVCVFVCVCAYLSRPLYPQ